MGVELVSAKKGGGLVGEKRKREGEGKGRGGEEEGQIELICLFCMSPRGRSGNRKRLRIDHHCVHILSPYRWVVKGREGRTVLGERGWRSSRRSCLHIVGSRSLGMWWLFLGCIALGY